MRRACLIALIACAAAVPAKGQFAPRKPLLQYSNTGFAVPPSGAPSLNLTDRSLYVVGAATLGAGVGTGVMWGAVEIIRANNSDDDDGDDEIGFDDEAGAKAGAEIAVAGLAVAALLSPWIGASYGALRASGLPYQQWQGLVIFPVLAGAAGTVVGTTLGGGFDAPITVSKVAGFVLGTGVGAALGAMFTLSQRSSLVRLDAEGWHVSMPMPRLSRAPDGDAAGSVSFVRMQF